MTELLLPRTDGGVAVQIVATIVVGLPVVIALAKRRLVELVWFAGGVVVLLLGLFAFRAVH